MREVFQFFLPGTREEERQQQDDLCVGSIDLRRIRESWIRWIGEMRLLVEELKLPAINNKTIRVI